MYYRFNFYREALEFVKNNANARIVGTPYGVLSNGEKIGCYTVFIQLNR